jgi:hypothetical protein
MFRDTSALPMNLVGADARRVGATADGYCTGSRNCPFLGRLISTFNVRRSTFDVRHSAHDKVRASPASRDRLLPFRGEGESISDSFHNPFLKKER